MTYRPSREYHVLIWRALQRPAPSAQPPVAAPDAYTTTEGGTLSVALPGVLENDTDAEGDQLRVGPLTLPEHGTLLLTRNGGFTYTPDDGWSGDDSFMYCAYDGSDYSDWTIVTITVLAAAPPVTIEDQAAGVIFDRWITGYSTAYTGGTYVYGRFTGTELLASFTGNRISWVGPKQPAYGKADVYIDDVFAATVDCYAASPGVLSTTIWESAALTDGPHTLKIRLTGQKNPASTGYVVVIDNLVTQGSAPAGAGTRIDDSLAAPGYSGTWVAATNPTYYNSTYRYSRWTNAAFSHTFTGTSVAWIGPRTPNYGIAEVWIDGVLVATVDTYRASLAAQGWREVVWQSDELPPGQHTIQIRPTGLKNPAATAANIVIDALDVTR